jgi:hypothetical protein
MICSKAEYQGAQRELEYLKEFLTKAERSADEPNKELTLIGIYKKMYHLWEELEEYYRAQLAPAEHGAPDDDQRQVAPVAVAER